MRWIILGAYALGLAMLPAAVDAQAPGSGSQRSNQGSQGEKKDRGGFSIQIGPGGVQLGAGSGPGGQNSPRPNSPGNDPRRNNNPGWNNNWNNNNNNWNNDWNRWDRRGVILRPEPVIRVPITPALPAPPAEPILLVNPASTQAAVQYSVNQYSYVLPPGSTQQLDGYRAWTIDFDRGSNYGRQQYALVPGRTYRFTPGPRGWELYVVTAEVPPLPGPSGVPN
jgi:hypothetical protein